MNSSSVMWLFLCLLVTVRHTHGYCGAIDDQSPHVILPVKKMKQDRDGKNEQQQIAADQTRGRHQKQKRRDDFASPQCRPDPLRKPCLGKKMGCGRGECELHRFNQNDQTYRPPQTKNGQPLASWIHFAFFSFFKESPSPASVRRWLAL